VAAYIKARHTTFILDILPSGDESAHVNTVFRKALELAGNTTSSSSAACDGCKR
jgi:hypothetical protein